MFGRSRHTSLTRQLALLSILPLALTGTGYALFSQNLSIAADTAKPAYSSSQYLYVTYTKTETKNGNNTNYSFNPVTITNTGVTSVTAWQIKFNVPSNVTTVTCSSAVTCTKSGVTVTVVNKTANATIAAGATRTFTVSFTSATAKYTLQNVIVSGTLSTAYQTVAGLTVGFVRGTRTQNGSTYTYPYTFTVANASGQNLSAWQAQCTWTNNATTSTVSTNVNYTTAAARITFTSKTALNTGENIVFTGTFTKNSSTWTISACTVTGKG